MVYPFFYEKVLIVEIPAFVNAKRSLPIQCMLCPKYYSTEKHDMYIGFKNMFYEVKILLGTSVNRVVVKFSFMVY